MRIRESYIPVDVGIKSSACKKQRVQSGDCIEILVVRDFLFVPRNFRLEREKQFARVAILNSE